MRLRLLTVVGTMALALAAPSAALAHHGRGHHRHHSNRGHHHVVNIGPGHSTSSSGTPPSEENAGTVGSYEKEVLTLTLKDGSTVSGKVTADTHIKCIVQGGSGEPGEEGPGDDNGAGDDQSRGDMNQSGGGWGNHHKDGGDKSQQNTTPEPPCDTSALVKGAVVHSAQLRVAPSGNEFECIVLVRESS